MESKPIEIKQIGDYVVLCQKVLGQGSFGTVYEGYKETPKGYLKVAVKAISLEKICNKIKVEQVKREIDNMRDLLQCNHIVRLYDTYQTPNNVYMMMEFCEGGTLQKVLNKGPLPEPEARRLFSQLSLAFKALFAKNILHRDVKPENILIQGTKCMLADFGLSRILQEDQKANTYAGTRVYMAPQIIDGSGFYTSKCDIWSLGVVLYEALYGKLPFRMTKNGDLVKLIKTGILDFPTKTVVSPELQGLLTKMLRVNEDDRCDWDTFFNFDWDGTQKRSPSPGTSGMENTSPMDSPVKKPQQQDSHVTGVFLLQFDEPDITESLSLAIEKCQKPYIDFTEALNIIQTAMKSFLTDLSEKFPKLPDNKDPAVVELVNDISQLCRKIRQIKAESGLGYPLTLLWGKLIWLMRDLKDPGLKRDNGWQNHLELHRLEFLEENQLRREISQLSKTN